MGDVMVNKLPSVKNLTNPFTKTLMRRVFVGQMDNVSFKSISSML